MAEILHSPDIWREPPMLSAGAPLALDSDPALQRNSDLGAGLQAGYHSHRERASSAGRNQHQEPPLRDIESQLALPLDRLAAAGIAVPPVERPGDANLSRLGHEHIPGQPARTARAGLDLNLDGRAVLVAALALDDPVGMVEPHLVSPGSVRDDRRRYRPGGRGSRQENGDGLRAQVSSCCPRGTRGGRWYRPSRTNILARGAAA